MHSIARQKLMAASNARGVSQIAIDNCWSSRNRVVRDTQDHVVSRLSQMIMQKCSKRNIFLLIMDSPWGYRPVTYRFRRADVKL